MASTVAESASLFEMRTPELSCYVVHQLHFLLFAHRFPQVWTVGEISSCFRIALTSTAHPTRASKRRIISIPWQRDPHFVGRVDALQEIENSLITQGSIALSGAGGVGYVSDDLYTYYTRNPYAVRQKITNSHRVLLAIQRVASRLSHLLDLRRLDEEIRRCLRTTCQTITSRLPRHAA